MKRILFSILLLYWLFCLPLAVAVYTPWTYQLNCHWNERCERIGLTVAEQSGQELAGFFRHQQASLATPWTEKEHQHLSEVRGIYDMAFLAFACISLLFVLDLTKHRQLADYRHYATGSLALVIGLLLVMLAISPFFNFFWMEIFHPLVFDNELWRTDPGDISWYLMPKTYFLRVILFLLATTVILNLLLVWRLPKPR